MNCHADNRDDVYLRTQSVDIMYFRHVWKKFVRDVKEICKGATLKPKRWLTSSSVQFQVVVII